MNDKVFTIILILFLTNNSFGQLHQNPENTNFDKSFDYRRFQIAIENQPLSKFGTIITFSLNDKDQFIGLKSFYLPIMKNSKLAPRLFFPMNSSESVELIPEYDFNFSTFYRNYFRKSYFYDIGIFIGTSFYNHHDFYQLGIESAFGYGWKYFKISHRIQFSPILKYSFKNTDGIGITFYPIIFQIGIF